MKFYTIFLLFLFEFQLYAPRNEDFYKTIEIPSAQVLIESLNKVPGSDKNPEGFKEFTRTQGYKIEDCLANRTISLEEAYFIIQDLFFDCCEVASEESEQAGWYMALHRNKFFWALLKENNKSLSVLYQLNMLVRTRFESNVIVDGFGGYHLKSDINDTYGACKHSLDID